MGQTSEVQFGFVGLAAIWQFGQSFGGFKNMDEDEILTSPEELFEAITDDQDVELVTMPTFHDAYTRALERIGVRGVQMEDSEEVYLVETESGRRKARMFALEFHFDGDRDNQNTLTYAVSLTSRHWNMPTYLDMASERGGMHPIYFNDGFVAASNVAIEELIGAASPMADGMLIIKQRSY